MIHQDKSTHEKRQSLESAQKLYLSHKAQNEKKFGKNRTQSVLLHLFDKLLFVFLLIIAVKNICFRKTSEEVF